MLKSFENYYDDLYLEKQDEAINTVCRVCGIEFKDHKKEICSASEGVLF